MKCTKCGSDLKSTEKFCKRCGERNLENPSQTPQVTSEPPAAQQSGNVVPIAPPPPVAPKPAKTAKPKKAPKQRNIKGFKLLIFQEFTYVVLAAMMFFIAFFEKSLVVETTKSDSLIIGDFSILNAIGNLVFGDDRYNPTVLSIVMGITVSIFIFAAAAFWLFCVIAAILRKGETGMRRMSVILTFGALATVCALPHLAYAFVSQFKLIYARAIHTFPDDIKGITAPLSYIIAAIVVLLIITTWIFASKRKKKEGTVQNNEK